MRHLKTHLALLFVAALMSANALAACGPVEGTYVLKNRFAPDNTLQVTRAGKAYHYTLDLNFADRENDGSLTTSGTSEGSFSVTNCRAKAYDTENECRLSFVFNKDDRVSIRQLDSCLTFGNAVDATGEYKKQKQQDLKDKTTKGERK